MVLQNNTPAQGEVWLFDPDPVKGTEIGKKLRPALIISCNEVNKGPSGIVIVVPLTSKNKKIISHVKVEPLEGGLDNVSFIVSEHIRSISKERLIKKLGKINNRTLLQAVYSRLLDLLWID